MIHLTADSILVSPLDFHGYPIDIPPLKNEHREGAIRYLLRTLHPGDPSDTRIDYWTTRGNEHTLTRSGGRVIAFAVSQAILDTFTERNKSLIPGISLLSSAPESAQPGIHLGIIISPEWIEIALFRDGQILTTTAITPGKDAAWIEHLPNMREFVEPEHMGIFIISMEIEKAEMDRIENKMIQAGYGKPVQVDLKTIVGNLIPQENRIYQASEKKNTINQKWILTILIILNIFASVAAIHRFAANAENRLAELKKVYETQNSRAVEINTISTEIREIEEARTKKYADTPIAPYIIISEITSKLAGAWIRSLVIRENSFQLEAEGADALVVRALLANSNKLMNVSLHQATPSPIKGELFSISGNIIYDSK